MPKVTKPGTLSFGNGTLCLAGWTFFDPALKPGESRDVAPIDTQEVIRAALVFLAERNGAPLTQPEPLEHFTLDQERAALDVIAQARWAEKE